MTSNTLPHLKKPRRRATTTPTMAALLLIAGAALAAPYATPDFTLRGAISAPVVGGQLSLVKGPADAEPTFEDFKVRSVCGTVVLVGVCVCWDTLLVHTHTHTHTHT
jgi:hypothetical protein